MSQGFRDRHVRARVAHVCDLCGRRIDPGERYRYQALADNGTIRSSRVCAHCWAAAFILDLWDGIDPDDGITGDDFAQYDPRDDAEARILGGWHARWRDDGGDLLPVPQHADEEE